jgi:UDP-N-acetylbacillosamine N-acetyltransferase
MTTSSPHRLVIWGAGGHASVVVDLVRLTGEFEIVGFLDDVNPHRRGEFFLDHTILGGREQLEGLRAQGVTHAFVAVGPNGPRWEAQQTLERTGWTVPVLIHPKATVSSMATIGGGSCVFAGAVVQAGARIGRSVIVNTCAAVDHDCQIDDAVHLAPGVRLAGAVQIGARSMLGIGSCVIPKVMIGPDILIPAGSVVVRDVQAKRDAASQEARP